MKVTEAFSPGHITGLFCICDTPVDPLEKGSKGAGVSISHGVKTKVTLKQAQKSSLEILINQRMTSKAVVSKTVAEMLLSQKQEMYTTTVEHTVNIPSGAGFGSSGSAALSLAFALKEALNLKLDNIEVGQIAHKAEIICRTGLGTVIAEFFGGLEVRTRPGAPGRGCIQQLPVDDNLRVVSLSFGQISTKTLLSDSNFRHRANSAGSKLANRLLKEPTVQNFMNLSRKFAERIGLVTGKSRQVLNETDKSGFVCSIPMLGEGVFSIVAEKDVNSMLEIFQKYSNEAEVLVSEIDLKGARIL